MHAAVDAVADARVVDRALRDPVRLLARADAPVLRLQEDRVVRLVPGQPVPDGRERGVARGRGRCRRGRAACGGLDGHIGAAVALRRRVGEVAQVARERGRVREALALVRPGRRAPDREEHLDVVLRRLPHHVVVRGPVVGLVGRVGRVCRPPGAGDAAPAAPVERGADDLDAERLQRRHRAVGVAERLGLVEQADEHVAGGMRCRGHEACEHGGQREGGKKSLHGQPPDGRFGSVDVIESDDRVPRAVAPLNGDLQSLNRGLRPPDARPGTARAPNRRPAAAASRGGRRPAGSPRCVDPSAVAPRPGTSGCARR